MQAAQLPASAGPTWIRQGYYLFRKQPISMMTWALTIGFLIVIASILAPVGPLLFVMLMPCLSVMTLEACRQVEAGKTLVPLRMFKVLRHNGLIKPLLLLGLLHLILVLAAGTLVFMPFSDTIATALNNFQADSPAALYQAVFPLLILFGVSYALLAALFWFAPGLIAWEKLSIKRALFYSIIAFWRNKWAFLLYALGWGIAVAAVELASRLLIGIGLPAGFVGLLQLPVNFTLTAVLYASVYFSYINVLGPPEAPSLLP